MKQEIESKVFFCPLGEEAGHSKFLKGYLHYFHHLKYCMMINQKEMCSYMCPFCLDLFLEDNIMHDHINMKCQIKKKFSLPLVCESVRKGNVK
jgi:hypothetical protein